MTTALRALIAAAFALLASVSVADEVLLQYDRYAGELGIRDTTPKVTVFASGLVHIYRPAYWRNPGLFELQLSEPEFAQLQADVSAIDWSAWSSAKLAGAVERAFLSKAASTGVIEIESDTTLVDFHVSGPVSGRLLVESLPERARAFPKIEGLVQLAALERRVRLIANSSQRVHVAPATSVAELVR